MITKQKIIFRNGEQVGIENVEIDIDALRDTLVLSNANARIKLVSLGLFNAVNTVLMALPETDEMRIQWEYGGEFHRNNPLLIRFFHDIGYTDEQIDVLFL